MGWREAQRLLRSSTPAFEDPPSPNSGFGAAREDDDGRYGSVRIR